MTASVPRTRLILAAMLTALAIGSGWDGASCSVEHPPTPAEVTQ